MVEEFKKIGFHIYKPSKNESIGAAAQFEFSPKAKSVFVSFARQKGEKLPPGSTGNQFDWENKIVVKLDETDMGKFLAVFENRIPGFDTVHTSNDKTRMTSIKFQKQTGEYTNFALAIMQKEGDIKKDVRVFIDHHEASVLSRFLAESVLRSCGF